MVGYHVLQIYEVSGGETQIKIQVVNYLVVKHTAQCVEVMLTTHASSSDEARADSVELHVPKLFTVTPRESQNLCHIFLKPFLTG